MANWNEMINGTINEIQLDIESTSSYSKRRLITIAFSLHIAFISLVFAEYLRFDYLTPLRDVIGIPYLLLIPGLLLLLIIKPSKLIGIRFFLYSIGSSIIIIISIGICLQSICDFLGISKPISIIPLTVSLGGIIQILIILAYRKIRIDYLNDEIRIVVHNLRQYEIRFLFLLLLLPILTIIGIDFLNNYSSNIVLLLLFLLIAIIMLIALTKSAQFNRIYPFLIFSFSISLLYSKSLISPHVWLGDSSLESWTAFSVLSSGYWNTELISDINSLPLISLFYPILSIFLDINIPEILKWIYPLLFSLVPICLFEFLRQRFSSKGAFMSTFFFISFFPFYGEMLSVTRQGFAELFLILFLLILFSSDFVSYSKTLIAILFLIGIIWTHYGISYFFMIFLIFSLIASKIVIKSLNSNKRMRFLPGILNAQLVFLYALICVGWYLNVSSSSTFNNLTNLGSHFISNIMSLFEPLQQPLIQQALGLTSMPSIAWEISRYLQMFSQFLIVIGAMVLMKDKNHYPTYKNFILISLIIILASITFPYIASSLNITRIYHFLLIILAPCCIIGFEFLIRWGNERFKFFRSHISGSFLMLWISRRFKIRRLHIDLSILISIILLLPYFLFQSGFVFELSKDIPSSYSLSKIEIEQSKNIIIRMNFAYIQQTSEYNGANWLINNMNKSNHNIYCDFRTKSIFFERGFINNQVLDITHLGSTWNYGSSYLFLRKINTELHIMIALENGSLVSIPLSQIFNTYGLYSHKIFSNSDSEIYFKAG